MWLSNAESALRLIVLVLVSVAGIQDLRNRRVSNVITIPFFFAGWIANFLRCFYGGECFSLAVWIQAAVIFAAYHGWMGGADMKIFVGLLGMFPAAGIAAFIASGIVGGAVWGYTRQKDATFPAVTVSAFATALMLILFPSMPFFVF